MKSKMIWGVVLVGAAAILAAGGGAAVVHQPTSETAGGVETPQADDALAAYRQTLLAIAFDAASAMPPQPHIKNRSRAQEAVVEACLELDQPSVALQYVEQIDNWRRGNGYGDLAVWWARRGDERRAWDHAELAGLEAAEEGLAEWRRDRIRVRIAEAYAVLGHATESEAIVLTLGQTAIGKLTGAGTTDAAAVEQSLAEVDRMVALGNMDITRNALESSVTLFGRFYDDVERRGQVERKVKQSWDKLPIFLRIELLMTMARAAIDHGDLPEALALTDEAQTIFDGAVWPLHAALPLRARLAALRHQAGDPQRARAQADETLALYDQHGETIESTFRARAIRPLAEAYQTMGDADQARVVYGRTLEAGAVNANSRPRSIDLSATCSSMAVHGVEPDDGLWARILRIREELGPPW